MPIIVVITGVNAFSIPATELLISVSAKAKSIAGVKLEITPSRRSFFQCALKLWFIFFNAIGSNTRLANKILNVPTCSGSKANKPFFIRINELPHISERNIRTNTGNDLFCFSFSKIMYKSKILVLNSKS